MPKAFAERCRASAASGSANALNKAKQGGRVEFKARSIKWPQRMRFTTGQKTLGNRKPKALETYCAAPRLNPNDPPNKPADRRRASFSGVAAK